MQLTFKMPEVADHYFISIVIVTGLISTTSSYVATNLCTRTHTVPTGFEPAYLGSEHQVDKWRKSHVSGLAVRAEGNHRRVETSHQEVLVNVGSLR